MALYLLYGIVSFTRRFKLNELLVSYCMQNNWLTVSLYANRKKKVRESELKLKCLHLSLSLSFTFTWNLSRKMSRKSRLTGNGNLTFAICRKRES